MPARISAARSAAICSRSLTLDWKDRASTSQQIEIHSGANGVSRQSGHRPERSLALPRSASLARERRTSHHAARRQHAALRIPAVRPHHWRAASLRQTSGDESHGLFQRYRHDRRRHFRPPAGFRWVACASTGNTSASMAAYAARGGMRSLVLVPEGKISWSKLSQALDYGAVTCQLRTDFDGCLSSSRNWSAARPSTN